MRLSAVLHQFIVMGIDVKNTAANCQYSAVKRIDLVVGESIRKWFTGEGMDKHLTLGLAAGYTYVDINAHPYWIVPSETIGEPDEELLKQIHEEAIRMEELKSEK